MGQVTERDEEVGGKGGEGVMLEEVLFEGGEIKG